MLEVLLMKYEEWPSPNYKDILELQYMTETTNVRSVIDEIWGVTKSQL